MECANREVYTFRRRISPTIYLELSKTCYIAKDIQKNPGQAGVYFAYVKKDLEI